MYINGKEEGDYKVYYEDGQLWRESKFKNGEEVVPTKWYYEDGDPLKNK